MTAEDGSLEWMVDQTVWQIQGYEKGYFWGKTAGLLYPAGTDGGSGTPGMRNILGNLLPDGRVYITFVPLLNLGGAMAINATGTLSCIDGAWGFQMQMSTGTNVITCHWANMLQLKPGEPDWERLPGTSYSVPAFFQAAAEALPQAEDSEG